MKNLTTDVVVLGGGPGGYAAAFYAADLGMSVILVDKGTSLGGVCLNRGCIPSKALIHATEVLREAEHSSERGVTFASPKIDLDKLRSWKDGIVNKLGKGVASLAKQSNVTVIQGKGLFEDNETLRVETKDGQKFIKFKECIIAVGTKPALPASFDLGNKRIMTSTEALEIEDIPKTLLLVGGGYIGLELGFVYAALGSKVTLVEAMDTLLMGADADLVRPVMKKAKQYFKDVHLNTKVVKMATKGKQISVTISQEGKDQAALFDKVLVAIGRTPNSNDFGLKNTDIKVDEKGFIRVDDYQKTTVPNIYAIGDIAGGLLLAHKASKEARVAVESINGEPYSNKDTIIPAVVFTDPEVAWCGLTEAKAKAEGKKVKVSKFPWAALGRALTLDNADGFTKLIIEPETDKILGVGIVGPHAGDLISEAVLAIEMGANAMDIAQTVHPHPTLGESMMEAAEVYYGHSSHMKS